MDNLRLCLFVGILMMLICSCADRGVDSPQVDTLTSPSSNFSDTLLVGDWSGKTSHQSDIFVSIRRDGNRVSVTGFMAEVWRDSLKQYYTVQTANAAGLTLVSNALYEFLGQDPDGVNVSFAGNFSESGITMNGTVALYFPENEEESAMHFRCTKDGN